MRVFVVDDHEVVRRGVQVLVDLEPDLELVGQSGRVDDALVAIEQVQPDVAVIDVRLPDGDGVRLCRELRRRGSPARCLLWSAHTDEELLMRAVAAGAAGLWCKDLTPTGFATAVRRVAAGEAVFAPLVLARHDGASAAPSRFERRLGTLTDRERQVLELIADGLSNRQIGAELALAEKTVKNYVSHLLAKLGLERRTQAAVLLARLQLDGGRTRTEGPAALSGRP